MATGDSYAIHELFHTTCLMAEGVNLHLLEHPSFHHLPREARVKIREASELLAEAYADIGRHHC